MPMVDVIREHVEIVEGASGPKARIAGHRIRVQDVAVLGVEFGLTADEIVEEMPIITLADVHAALAYYWDHREEIEAQIVEEQTFVEQLKRAQGSGPLARRIRRLLDEYDSASV
jgi:uncharacterized protein (DUF433 family)